MRKTTILLMIVLFLISGCASDDIEELPETVEIIPSVEEGEYAIMTPFATSVLRQNYAVYFREIEMMEIGRRLQEKSKEFFSPDSYYISEGSLVDSSTYYQLLGSNSDTNPYGLNPQQPYEFAEGSVTLTNPVFASDIVELNFYQSADTSTLAGVSLTLVLKRVQVLDASIGSTHRLSDATLYQVGSAMGHQLQAYIRTLDGMADVPILIALYAQESDIDNLPGNYLPGSYLGFAYSESSRNIGQFTTSDEGWVFLSDTSAAQSIPEVTSQFSLFKKDVQTFLSDESIGVVGKAFLNNQRIEEIQIEITSGFKTYLEVSGLAQYISQRIESFEDFNIPIVVNIKLFQNSRIVVSKQPGQSVQITTLY